MPQGDRARIDTDHLAVGHVTIDVLADGTHLPGGTAVYSALLAARWGARATILTAGDVDLIDAMLGGLDDDVDVIVQPGGKMTTLATTYDGARRTQHVVARADDIQRVEATARVVHLGPVLHEVDSAWCDQRGAFVGLTPQGLLRRRDADGSISLHEPPGLSRYRADGIVISEEEEPYCADLVRSQRDETVVVTTHAERGATVHTAAGDLHVDALRVEGRSDLGAGDTFAAALFHTLAEGAAIRNAVCLAHAAAAAKVAGRPGPAGVPDRAAATALLDARTPGD